MLYRCPRCNANVTAKLLFSWRTECSACHSSVYFSPSFIVAATVLAMIYLCMPHQGLQTEIVIVSAFLVCFGFISRYFLRAE